MFSKTKTQQETEQPLLPSATRALVTTLWEFHVNGIGPLTEIAQLALGEKGCLGYLIRTAPSDSSSFLLKTRCPRLRHILTVGLGACGLRGGREGSWASHEGCARPSTAPSPRLSGPQGRRRWVNCCSPRGPLPSAAGKVGGPGARRDGKAVGGAPVRLRGCEASGIFAAVFSWAGPGWSRRPGEKLPQAERAGAGGGPTGGNSAD